MRSRDVGMPRRWVVCLRDRQEELHDIDLDDPRLLTSDMRQLDYLMLCPEPARASCLREPRIAPEHCHHKRLLKDDDG